MSYSKDMLPLINSDGKVPGSRIVVPENFSLAFSKASGKTNLKPKPLNSEDLAYIEEVVSSSKNPFGKDIASLQNEYDSYLAKNSTDPTISLYSETSNEFKAWLEEFLASQGTTTDEGKAYKAASNKASYVSSLADSIVSGAKVVEGTEPWVSAFKVIDQTKEAWKTSLDKTKGSYEGSLTSLGSSKTSWTNALQGSLKSFISQQGLGSFSKSPKYSEGLLKRLASTSGALTDSALQSALSSKKIGGFLSSIPGKLEAAKEASDASSIKAAGLDPYASSLTELEKAQASIASSTDPFVDAKVSAQESYTKWVSDSKNLATASKAEIADLYKAHPEWFDQFGAITDTKKVPANTIKQTSSEITGYQTNRVFYGYYYAFLNDGSGTAGYSSSPSLTNPNTGQTESGQAVYVDQTDYSRPIYGNVTRDVTQEYLKSYNSQIKASADKAKGSLDLALKSLTSGSSVLQKSNEWALGSVGSSIDSIKNLQAAWAEKYKWAQDFKPTTSGITTDSSGVKVNQVTGALISDQALYQNLTEAQSTILRAVLDGQTDVQALSTYSGLKINDVIKTLNDLKRKGRLPNTGIVSSKATTSRTSGTSSSFWKRVTSI